MKAVNPAAPSLPIVPTSMPLPSSIIVTADSTQSCGKYTKSIAERASCTTWPSSNEVVFKCGSSRS